jgi:hypothetical protein
MVANIIFHQVLLDQYNSFGGNAEQLANRDLEYDLCGLSTASQVDEITQATTPKLVWQMNPLGSNQRNRSNESGWFLLTRANQAHGQ